MRDVIRDPLYGPIPLDDTARQLIDTAVFQRLRRVRQLSLASVLYPSAMHTRFEHSVGVYHLAGTIVRQLAAAGELESGEVADLALISHAGLLHDTGQHMCAHLLEEFGYPGVSHEEAGAALFTTGEIGDVLAQSGIPAAGERIAAVVEGRSDHPLTGVVSGACDADKLDYLARDAYHCGLPVGFDQEHLRDALCVVVNPGTGRRETGLDETGIASFEHMLYSKNALYRNVYFHTTVRCAMVMLRALVVAALEAGFIAVGELYRWSDEELFTVLRVRVSEERRGGSAPALVRDLLDRLLVRRLYRCAVSLPLSAEVPLSYEAVLGIETELASRLGLQTGEALLDIPRKPSMLSTEILVRRYDGAVVGAGSLTPDDGFALNDAHTALYAASGRISVFTASPARLDVAVVREVMGRWAGAPQGLDS